MTSPCVFCVALRADAANSSLNLNLDFRRGVAGIYLASFLRVLPSMQPAAGK